LTSTAVPAAAPERAPLDRALLSVAAVVVLGAIMAILDTTVVNVAINTLARDFDTPLATIQWVATGYTLALATVIPLTGWAADRFGTKRLYMTSIALFMGGSLLSGLAWSAESLIGFRVLQGLGGGMLMPLGMTILTRAAGPGRVGRVMSIIGVPMLLGPIFGPILGGWLVDDVSWRWIFFINLPIAIAALALAARVLARDVPQPSEALDTVGVLLLSPGLAAFIYGLAQSGSGGFAQAKVIVPAVTGALLLVAFATASGMLALFTIAVFGSMLLLPLYLQAVRGESAMASGLLLAPQGFGAMIVMPIAGQLTDRIGIGKIVLTGMVLILGATLALTQIAADTSYWTLSIVLFVFGMGMGSTMMPIMSGAMQTLRKAAVARASTALNIIQQVGASIGTAVMTVILTNQLASRLPAGGGDGLGATAVPPAVRDRIAPLMAEAFGATFWWAFGLLLVAFGFAFLLPRTKPEPAADLEEEQDREPVPVLVAA
jgi:MFS family permease